MSQSPKIKASKKNGISDLSDKETKLDKRHRHSLQPKTDSELPPSSLRHTQSHRYESKGKTKSKRPITVSYIPSIMEAENSEDEIEKTVEERKEKTRSTPSVSYENERKRAKSSKTKMNDSSGKAVFSFENSAFEGSMDTKRTSNLTIRTNSSRAPSIQSLEVVREQYCCCAKRTKCERTLLTTVTILIIVIIVLVVVVVILAKNHDFDDLKMNYLGL
ncbi:hypothetical protein NQ318_012283 [Aromia moschata]|uniref:Uncharacterized protein n=1 Tax=Aromia moschata TaxID=1265417 RepID=A0AAV8YKG8_9CUCU|nr:hypothetical protein NQ318_012283 [Aromia moschata]